MIYDHKKIVEEARERERRRELLICAAAFMGYAAVVAMLAWLAAGSPAEGLLWTLAGLFVVSGLWAAGHALAPGGDGR